MSQTAFMSLQQETLAQVEAARGEWEDALKNAEGTHHKVRTQLVGYEHNFWLVSIFHTLSQQHQGAHAGPLVCF